MKPKPKSRRTDKQRLVAWMPVCVGDPIGASRSAIGPWPRWIRKTKKEVAKSIRENAAGYRFDIVPVYYDAALTIPTPTQQEKI